MRLKNNYINYFVFFISLAIFFAILSNNAAAGVGVANCGPNYVQYAPYKVVSFYYIVLRPPTFKVSTGGDLKQYYDYTVDKNVIKGTLTLPPDYNVPGTHLNLIRVTENPPTSGGTAVGVASVNCPIYVVVPYPGKYLTFEFHAKNINTGDALPAAYTIVSKGDQIIYDATVKINVVKNGRTYDSYTQAIPSISPAAKISKSISLQTQDLSPGLYDVNAYLNYGNKTLNATQQIRVGSLDINVLNITSNITPAPYSKINFTLENNWNNPVKNVYVTYTITSADLKFKEVQTPSVDFGPFEKKTIESIAETPGIVPGRYFITYQVHFEDNTKKGTAPLIVRSPPSSKGSMILILSGILLTIMMILLFILLKRQNGGRRLKKAEDSLSASDTDDSQSTKKAVPQDKKKQSKSNKKK